MKKEDVKVGQVFHCNERGTMYPYFTVTSIVSGNGLPIKARGRKTMSPDGSVQGGSIKVSISLARLIKDNAGGYRLVENVTVLHPESNPRPEPPKAARTQEPVAASSTAIPAAGETTTTAQAAPATQTPESAGA